MAAVRWSAGSWSGRRQPASCCWRSGCRSRRASGRCARTCDAVPAGGAAVAAGARALLAHPVAVRRVGQRARRRRRSAGWCWPRRRWRPRLRWRRSRAARGPARALLRARGRAPAGRAGLRRTPLGFGIFHFVSDVDGALHARASANGSPTLPTDPLGVMFWLAALALLVLVVTATARAASAAGAPVDGLGRRRRRARAVAARVPVRSATTAPFVLLATPAASRLLGADVSLPPRRARRRARQRPGRASPDHPRLNLGAARRRRPPRRRGRRAALPVRHTRLGWRPISDGALAAMRACDGPLYNHYDEGGYLIWFVPEKPVFIDSRQDPYPLPFLLESMARRARPGALPPAVRRWGIRCVFLAHRRRRPSRRSARDGWITRYRDDKWHVSRRRRRR